jgi:hypothetical protein
MVTEEPGLEIFETRAHLIGKCGEVESVTVLCRLHLTWAEDPDYVALNDLYSESRNVSVETGFSLTRMNTKCQRNGRTENAIEISGVLPLVDDMSLPQCRLEDQ